MNNNINLNIKIACFIHSSNMDIHKTEILEYLIQYLHNKNVFDKIDFLFINNIGTNLDEEYFKKINDKIIVSNYSNDLNLFEACTIKQMNFFSKIHPDYKLLYLHTKGVSHEKNSKYSKGIASWINYMLYCLVDHFDSCIKLLDTNDVVGCNYKETAGGNREHFSGNFWWANSSYICNLPVHNFKEKFDVEFGLFINKPTHFNIYKLDYMYETDYNLKDYENKVISVFENISFKRE